MRSILQKRSLRFVFAANVISMIGSGMNSAAVAWTILQRTHSEMALGKFAVLQTIPAMLMLPFTGVLIDREDRRRLVMMAGCDPRHRHSCRHCSRVPASRTGVAALSDEHAGGRWILDVLADNHRIDTGADARGRVRPVQHILAGGNSGRLADRGRNRRIRLRAYRSRRCAADRRQHLRGVLLLLFRRAAEDGTSSRARPNFATISKPPNPPSDDSSAKCAKDLLFCAITAAWSFSARAGRCSWAR